MKRSLYRFWRQVTADKKKFGILCTVAAVGLLLWGRLILLEDVPRIATADPNTPAQQTGEASTAAAMPAKMLPPLPEVRVKLSDDLAMDLFAFRHNRYKLLPPSDTGDTDLQPGQTGDDVEERKRELMELARGLRLQSVIQGLRPAIMINGQLLRVGDSIEGFEVVSFNNRSAYVTRDGLTFILKMPK